MFYQGRVQASTARGAERREVTIETAFSEPGARDTFELVTRAVTGERFEVDPALMLPALGRARVRFVFADMAARVMSAAGAAVYDVAPVS